jgi:hypothetical protein
MSAVKLNAWPRLDTRAHEETTMLLGLAGLLIVLWLLGFSLHVAGGLIHLLLVLAVIVVIWNFVAGRRRV